MLVNRMVKEFEDGVSLNEIVEFCRTEKFPLNQMRLTASRDYIFEELTIVLEKLERIENRPVSKRKMKI